MISINDLQTSAWHQVFIDSNIRVTIYLDIKLSSITIYASSFLCHDYVLVSFIILVCIFKQVYYRSWAGYLEVYKKDYLQINACPDAVVVTWREYPQLLLIKVICRSYSEWWVEWLARDSISLTVKNINISFNPLPYYLMSRADGKIVTNKR